MPIDPSIPLGVQPPPRMANPLELYQGIQQARNINLENQARQEALEKARRAEAETASLDQAAVEATGLDDYLARITAAGHGHLAPLIRKQWGDADKAAADAADARTKAQLAEADYFGGLAASAMAWEKDGPEAVQHAAELALQHAKASGHDTTALEAMLQQNPGALPQVLAQLIEGSPKQRELRNSERGTAETGRHNLVGEGLTASGQAETGRHNLVSEASTTAGQAETARHNKVDESAAAATLRLAKEREAREQNKFDLTYGGGQNEAGAALPVSPQAKAIAEYRQPGYSGRAATTGIGKAMMDQVYKLNPSYDMAQYPTRQRMRIAYTSGPQSQTLNSLNTAIEHLDQFVGFAQAMGNGQFQPTNEIKNWLRTKFGDSAPTNFDGIKTVLSGEVAAALKKSGATDTEIANVERSMGQSGSPKQLIDYATKVVIPALGSKAGTYDAQWKAAMGDKDPFSVYTPGAKSVLEKYNKSAAPPPGAGPKVGDVVMVGGKRIKISAIHPDGTFDGDPVK